MHKRVETDHKYLKDKCTPSTKEIPYFQVLDIRAKKVYEKPRMR